MSLRDIRYADELINGLANNFNGMHFGIFTHRNLLPAGKYLDYICERIQPGRVCLSRATLRNVQLGATVVNVCVA